MIDETYGSTPENVIKREDIIRNGTLFEVFDQLIPFFRIPKTVAKTDVDATFNIHFIENYPTVVANKDRLKLAHFKRIGMVGNYTHDDTLKAFTARAKKNMKDAATYYEKYYPSFPVMGQ